MSVSFSTTFFLVLKIKLFFSEINLILIPKFRLQLKVIVVAQDF